MKKYLKYDLKSSNKFFLSTLVVFIIFLVSILSIRIIGTLNKMIRINSAIDSFKIIIPLILIMVLIWFIFNSFYKDLYTRNGILTFSLPLSFESLIFSKVLVINIFYLVLIGFVLILKTIANLNLEMNLKLLFLMVFLLINLFSQIMLLAMMIYRFKHEKIRAASSFLLIPLILLLNFLLPSYKKTGTYMNWMSFLYLFIVILVLFVLNIKYMKKNFDLS